MKTYKWMVACATMCLLIAGGADVASAAKHALLIGVNEYQSKQMNDLRGTHNDVEKMKDVLSLRYGFPEDSFRILLDEQATRQGILDALEDFVSSVGPDDIVYIHYSGHGSQVQDLNGDETDDGQDETIIPHDGRMPGIPDITDDEIASYVDRLQSKHALIVLDCCHSGTATRDVVLQTRSVPPDDRLELYSRVSTRAVTPLEADYVLMTGAANSESALDGPVGPSKSCYGLFTFALGTSLAEAKKELTPREIHDEVQRVFERFGTKFNSLRMPTPQLEGPPESLDRPLFAVAPGQEQSPTVDVRLSGADKVILSRAVELGAQVGSRWAVFPPDAEVIPGNAIAIAKIDGVLEGDATATLHPADAKIPNGSRAAPVTTSVTATGISVRFRGLSSDQRVEVENRLRGVVQDLSVVSENEFAQIAFEVSGNRCEAFTLGGLDRLATFEFTSLDDLVAEAAQVISRSENSALLGDLHNPASSIELSVRTALPKSAVARSFKTVASGDLQAYKVKKPGDPRSPSNSLVLEIEANKDCYITIVNVNAQGTVSILFPNQIQDPGFYSQGLIPGGETVRIPDSLERNTAGFNWDCTPPTGIESVQVFAATDLAAAEMIRDHLAALSRGAHIQGRSATVKPADIDALGGALAQRWLRRGFQVVPNETADQQQLDEAQTDWTSVSLTVLVEE